MPIEIWVKGQWGSSKVIENDAIR